MQNIVTYKIKYKNVSPFTKINEEIAYHGTDKQFDKFDKSYIYTDYAELGYGFYFDTDISNAESYGDKIFKVNLIYNKPFILSKSTYNWLAENLGEDTIDFKPEVEDLIKLISVDTLRATDIIQSKYDAIIADTQIVVFEPEQIEILEKIEETLSIKQLVERMEEFEEVQVLNQKELINELYKSKMEYRITYDANKNWFLIATAYNHTHEELLYNAAPAYGLNFNQMVDYYNEHYADLFDLIYTPKTEDIKVGFDHNNIAYIFNNFGTIYTKGQELSKVLLNDLTDRFGKPNIKRLEERLKDLIGESIQTEKVINKNLSNPTQNQLKEDLSSWKAGNPTIGERNAKIYELQKELDRLQTLKAELGKEISRISNKYYKQNRCWTSSEKWSQADQLKQKNNRKRQDEIMKQIDQLQADIKELRNYQPIRQTSLFESSNLKNWFGNSKVVDNKGNPLIVYHGSPEKFDTFEPDRMNYGSISRGFCFFTNKKSAYPNCAKDYAGKNGYVYECYLKIEKPLHIKYGNTPDEYYHTPVHYWDTCQSDIRREYRKGDYDGIIIENENKNEDDSIIYLVPNANQIKSVDAKEFLNNENIYENLNRKLEQILRK